MAEQEVVDDKQTGLDLHQSSRSVYHLLFCAFFILTNTLFIYLWCSVQTLVKLRQLSLDVRSTTG